MLLIVAKWKRKEKGEPKEDAGGHMSMSKQVSLTDEIQYF